MYHFLSFYPFSSSAVSTCKGLSQIHKFETLFIQNYIISSMQIFSAKLMKDLWYHLSFDIRERA